MFFKYEVIDNFMNEHDFNELCSLELNDVNSKKKKYTIIGYLKMEL